jgi:hypothetical protein
VGVDAFVSVAFELTDELSVDIGAEARHYGIDPNSGSADSNIVAGNNAYNGGAGLSQAVAGGAMDTYFGGFVSGHYTMPGAAR